MDGLTIAIFLVMYIYVGYKFCTRGGRARVWPYMMEGDGEELKFPEQAANRPQEDGCRIHEYYSYITSGSYRL
jgi:hypothetical protein